jgi:signal transduction histidine kinase
VLFQPFRRLHRHRTVAGTGLGPVIVKHLLEPMGGAVQVASVVARGSTLTVRLRTAPS